MHLYKTNFFGPFTPTVEAMMCPILPAQPSHVNLHHKLNIYRWCCIQLCSLSFLDISFIQCCFEESKTKENVNRYRQGVSMQYRIHHIVVCMYDKLSKGIFIRISITPESYTKYSQCMWILSCWIGFSAKHSTFLWDCKKKTKTAS